MWPDIVSGVIIGGDAGPSKWWQLDLEQPVCFEARDPAPFGALE